MHQDPHPSQFLSLRESWRLVNQIGPAIHGRRRSASRPAALSAHPAEKWLFGVAGAVSIGFAVGFVAFVLRWIEMDPGALCADLQLAGSYFAFCALCMLVLAQRPLRRGTGIHRIGNTPLLNA
jgi:hypothetical protein